jgi:hypothetical protein
MSRISSVAFPYVGVSGSDYFGKKNSMMKKHGKYGY